MLGGAYVLEVYLGHKPVPAHLESIYLQYSYYSINIDLFGIPGLYSYCIEKAWENDWIAAGNSRR